MIRVLVGAASCGKAWRKLMLRFLNLVDTWTHEIALLFLERRILLMLSRRHSAFSIIDSIVRYWLHLFAMLECWLIVVVQLFSFRAGIGWEGTASEVHGWIDSHLDVAAINSLALSHFFAEIKFESKGCIS